MQEIKKVKNSESQTDLVEQSFFKFFPCPGFCFRHILFFFHNLLDRDFQDILYDTVNNLKQQERKAGGI